jgi:hypothetical protein
MGRRSWGVLLAVAAIGLVPVAEAAMPNGADAGTFTLSNGIVRRTWSLAPFRTAELVDLRTGRVWSRQSNDFRLGLSAIEIRGDQLRVTRPPAVEPLAGGGTRVTFDLGIVHRLVEVYPGIAGFRSRTIVKVPGVLSSYTLDEAMPGGNVAVTLHGFRAGADWREPGWEPVGIGDPNTGDWRNTTHAAAGRPIHGTAQWLSAMAPGGASMFMVMERNDHASSTMRYDGTRVAARVDLSRDIAYLGPFEEQFHVQNPLPEPVPARVRLVVPPLALEPVFTGVALDADDEPWQHYAYLHRFRHLLTTAPVTFNSDSVDEDRISTGAKDDMDFAEVKRQAAIAKQLGVEVFILDDGWQARSGDWCPDSPQCPEPRHPQFPHRFPDATFAAVREAIAPMQLGLWMTPMSFHPSSTAFHRNPTWACIPLGAGTAIYNAVSPEESSNEAGIGLWNPLAIGIDGRLVDYIERRVRVAIEQWDVGYFKFDFLAWSDCVGVAPVDFYAYRDAFVAMVDRLIARHPDVTFQIDETNDYRTFPFESIARGPSWFQNGAPDTPQLLHNLWSLNPWVPGATIGQHTFGGSERETRDPSYLMAAALGSHLTFKTDLTTLTPAQIAAAHEWTDVYKAHRAALAGFTYPLLDDPASGKNWSALQPWDMDTQEGMVLVYRQDTADTGRRVPLRGLRRDAYDVRDARTGAALGTFTAAELTNPGLPVTLAAPFSAAVLVVEPAT